MKSDELFTHALTVRAFLENEWPKWHKIRGRPIPTPISRGTCQTSSLFLAKTFQLLNVEARVAHGNNLSENEGYFDGTRWIGHAWVIANSSIVDITADQFGRAPVCVEKGDLAVYKAGFEDTATQFAKAQRAKLVGEALHNWSQFEKSRSILFK